jgi:hypothetical protein
MKKVIITLAIILTVGCLFFAFYRITKENVPKGDIKNVNVSKEENMLGGKSSSVSIPEKVLANKFGFLGGGQDEDNPFVGNAGGAWARPHPGPFLWDAMQKDKGSEIDFSVTDKIVKIQQAQNYGTLATIWPFAEWDQKNNASAGNCAVSNQDEFLSVNDKKGRGDYLPLHRCNPASWEDYRKWVASLIERYDGDGIDDMPNLKIPIKYWEVMNEPDLSYGNDVPDADRLTFYKQGPKEYANLLIQTSEAIRLTDKDAKILIAGAAGASERYLNFYREVLSVDGVKSAFDIGNIHCISNDQGTSDFNVGAYKKMLSGLGIAKPIWVTEAESFNGTTAQENYELTKKSTQGAISTGAEKIFYTRYNFDDFRTDMSQKNVESEESIKNSEKQYLNITSQY